MTAQLRVGTRLNSGQGNTATECQAKDVRREGGSHFKGKAHKLFKIADEMSNSDIQRWALKGYYNYYYPLFIAQLLSTGGLARCDEDLRLELA